MTWMDLKDVKEANPIELAEYAVANQIENEPAFAWWLLSIVRGRTGDRRSCRPN